MAFWELIVLEWLLLLAAAMTFIGGIRGILPSVAILSVIAWFNHPGDFWAWEIPFLIIGGILVAIQLLLVRKAGNQQIVTGVAGRLTSLFILGAFLTPLAAVILWGVIIGTGLIPMMKVKPTLWGFAPILWRLAMGIIWIVYGNVFLTI